MPNLSVTFTNAKPAPAAEPVAEINSYVDGAVTGQLLVKVSAYPFVRLTIDRGGNNPIIDWNGSFDQLSKLQVTHTITDAEMNSIKAVVALIWTNLP